MDRRITSLKATIRLLVERKEMLDKYCEGRRPGPMSFHAGVSMPQLSAIEDLESARDHLAAAILCCEDALEAVEVSDA
jgi:hypothetical protein